MEWFMIALMMTSAGGGCNCLELVSDVLAHTYIANSQTSNEPDIHS